MKRLFKSKAALVVGVLIALALIALIAILLRTRPKWVPPILITLAVMLALWLLIEWLLRVFKKRKQKRLDEAIVAREGIEDRKLEWASWTAELDRQGKDRYDLPFYLLVGEPQSGKSILLHNSDLHFPFGQKRLSGPGGTRGCDWWFTDDAVILDLAGRLFTHEGGAADEMEWQAFLDLLVDYRPLCPANGILLVLPCDALLQDQREAVIHKTVRIKNALVTLVNKLQALLPIYVVLTKGDKVFGFAECVHRLDTPQREQMFGWSRPADRVEARFDAEEARAGFDEIVGRARLLAYEMMATARLPEAMPEVDRLCAFPEELKSIWPNLKTYLEEVFTDSTLVEKLLFRGFYITSGLQSGVPIAKVCAGLLGEPGHADSRNLEALFTKQRAYFIKDLVRTRVFGEKGLVRPTSTRVARARRTAAIGYGAAAAVMLVAVGSSVKYAATAKPELEADDQENMGRDFAALEQVRLIDADADLPQLLRALEALEAALKFQPKDLLDQMLQSRRSALGGLYASLFDHRVLPLLREIAASELTAELRRFSGDFNQLKKSIDDAALMCDAIDYSEPLARQSVLRSLSGEASALVPRLEAAFAMRADCEGSPIDPKPSVANRPAFLNELLDVAAERVDQTLAPGHTFNPRGALGYVLSFMGLEDSFGKLRDLENPQDASIDVDGLAATYSTSLEVLRLCREDEELGSGDRKKLKRERIADQVTAAERMRGSFLERVGSSAQPTAWPERDRVKRTIDKLFATSQAEIAPPHPGEMENEDLRQVCRADFLSVGEWSLDGFTEDLSAGMLLLANPKASKVTRNVYFAKCARRGREFCTEIHAWRELVDRTEYIHRSNPGEPFNVSLVRAVSELAIKLQQSDDSVGSQTSDWRGCIDTVLSAHLDSASALDAAIADSELTRLLGALATASRVGGGTQVAAHAKLDQYLGALQDALAEDWQRSLGQSAVARNALFTKFINFRRTLQAVPGAVAAGSVHSRWLADQVDDLLRQALQPSIDKIERNWTDFEVPAELPLTKAALAYSTELSRARLEQRCSAAKEPLPVPPDPWPEELKQSKQAFDNLRSLQESRTAAAIERLPFVDAVRREFEPFAVQAALESDGPGLAQALTQARAKVTAGSASIAKEDVSGGIRLAQAAWQKFEARALTLVRQKYLAELRSEFIDRRPAVTRALLAETPSEWNGFTGDALTLQAGEIFDRKTGSLDVLWKNYGRLGDPKDALPLDPGESATPGERAMWEFDASMKKLQTFLLGDKERLQLASIDVTFRRDLDHTGTVWDNKKDRPNAYVTVGASGPHEPEDFLPNKDLVVPWSFASSHQLLFEWSKDRNPARGTEYTSDVRTLFAPLLLAWMAPQPDSTGAWHVDLLFSDQQREAPVAVSFPKDRPLPPRPPNILKK